MPAFVTSFHSGNLRIVFNNDATTAQSVVISAINGKVTLNERAIHVKSSAVRSITVIGSDFNNFIDLHFVSTGTGFHRLDGKINLQGKGGDDVLMGSQFADKLSGGDGFDQLYAGKGNDTLNGGNGDDWIYGGYGKDVVIPSQGHDFVDVGPDN